MSKRKRQSKKKLVGKGRLTDARRWLQSGNGPRKSLVNSYSKRYGVTESVAWEDLMSLGYYDNILIEQYERDGIEWEYKVEPRSGDMFVVPKGTEEHEIYELHGII
jgi:hypothetical protein